MEKKAIGYYRVSTMAQDLTRQKKLVEGYCHTNGISLVRSYEDKITGATFEREGLTNLLKCTKEDADIVIISEFSRFSRDSNLILMVNEFSKLTTNGFDVVFLDDPSKVYEGGSMLPIMDVIMLIFKGYFAQEERKNIVKRMYDKRCQLLEANHYAHVDGKVPFGYEIVDNPYRIENPKNMNVPKREIRIKKSDAEIVKKIFVRYSEGETTASLARWFRKHVRKGMNASCISKMLGNEIYIGGRWRGGKMYSVEPILDEDLWRKVQAKKQKNKQIHHNMKWHDSVNLLKGLVRCGKCGGAMYINYSNPSKRNARSASYLCMHHTPERMSMHKPICPSKFGIQKRVMELIAKKSYIDVVGTEAFRTSINQMVENLRYDMMCNDNIIADIRKEIDGKKKERSNIPRLLLKGNLNASLVETLNETDLLLQSEIEGLRSKLHDYEASNKAAELQITKLQKTSNDNVPAIDPMELAEQFSDTMESVTLYSPYRSSHFVQIVYKSGYVANYICWSFGCSARIAELVGGTLDTKKLTYSFDGVEWEWRELYDFLMDKGLLEETILPKPTLEDD